LAFADIVRVYKFNLFTYLLTYLLKLMSYSDGARHGLRGLNPKWV